MPSRYRYFSLIHQALVCVFAILLVLFMIGASASQPGYAAAYYHSGVTDFWGGAGDSIALRSDGTVWTWGWDEYGVLGNGHGVTMFDTDHTYDSLVPYHIDSLESIQAIAGGERHNVALDTNGEVWAWGWNAYGQLGNGIACTQDAHSTDCMGVTPAKISNFSAVKAIASRGYHTLALENDGTLWAWGANQYGQLGDGSYTDRHSPVPVGGLSGHGGVAAISGGGEVSAALMNDHTLLAWGRNEEGAVGNGVTSTLGITVPMPVSQSSGLTNVTAIATGWDHMVALAADGSVWTWGGNGGGQLGNGAKTNSSLPVRVSGLSNVTGISAGDASTVVLKSDGTVWAWGVIRHGDGSDYDYGPTPARVAGIDRVILVRARNWQVYALRAGGAVYAWGANTLGECGNGAVGGNTDAPGQVLFPDFLSQPSFLPSVLR